MASFARTLRPLTRASPASSLPRSTLSRRAAVLSRPARHHVPTRCLSSTPQRRYDTSNITTEGDPSDLSALLPTPITHFSEVETAMAETVSKFANEVVLPKVREMDENEKMDPEIIEQLFENGLMGIEIPEKYGGAGMNFTAAIVGIEELARVDPSVSVMVDVHNTLVNTAILKYGSEESRKKWLPQLATGTLGSFCLSEPASGSDAFALRTRAEKTADGYTINGSKMWITNSMEAGFFIVFANLHPDKGYKGITAFMIDKSTPGFSIAKKEKKLGIKASSTCVLNFDDVQIPHSNLLGKEGEGYKYAIGILNEGRIGIAAQMTGLALGAWENAASYVWNDRKQFGQFVGEFQGMQHQLAQAYTEICAARALVYNAARKKEAGEDFVRDAAMAKLFASQVAGRVSGSAVEWMGGMGFVREGLAEKYWRDSIIGKIYEGSSNIQLSTIAKLLQREYTR
ncbi:acyl-CoA dehydrogenase precursor [Polychaeton citri CBS 116435]|uniref:Short/branched chain specific acyl-CoA dehydrogenase, mitochondrial n=1 Tax=Polychaeton citri CBS 116435 TaxID=1314669 RepID=A0A9P4Q6B3_9PEZI|nr:acyl-CoA dehydrogenase precursor [Polychaeton citri CBS 116435]